MPAATRAELAARWGTALADLARDNERWQAVLDAADADPTMAQLARDRQVWNARFKEWIVDTSQRQGVLPVVESAVAGDAEDEPAPRRMQINVVKKLAEIAPDVPPEVLVKAGALVATIGEKNGLALVVALLMQHGMLGDS